MATHHDHTYHDDAHDQHDEAHHSGEGDQVVHEREGKLRLEDHVRPGHAHGTAENGGRKHNRETNNACKATGLTGRALSNVL